MAFDPNAQDPNAQAQQPGMAGQPPTTAAAPGAGPGPSGNKSAAPQANAPQPFQNLQAYLSSNAPQVQSQADTMAGNLNTEYGQTKSDINAGTSGFGTQVASGYAAPNQTLTDSAASNPTAFVSNPANIAAFQSLYNDQYTGPQNFESSTPYTNLSGEVSKAQNDATQTGSTAGLQTYFQGQNPNATAGGNMLDTVLLQGNPNAYETVQNAAAPFANLTDYLSNATTTADQGVTNAQTAAQNEAQTVQNQFNGPGGVVPTFQTNLNNELNTDVGQVNQYNDLVNSLISQNQGAQPDIANLENAVNAYNTALQTGENTYAGVPFSNVFANSSPLNLENINFSPPPTQTQPTLAQAATSQDIAEQNALEQLLGTGFNPTFDPTGATPFQAPGNVPTLNSTIDPALQNLEGQSVNPLLDLYPLAGNNPVIQPVNSALDALQKYLGEAQGSLNVLPVVPQSSTPGSTPTPTPTSPGSNVPASKLPAPTTPQQISQIEQDIMQLRQAYQATPNPSILAQINQLEGLLSSTVGKG